MIVGDKPLISEVVLSQHREAILPYILYIQKTLHRRPFFIKKLENVMRKFLQSLEFFEENERKKIAIFIALELFQKLSGCHGRLYFTHCARSQG
jgi:hypothetical protein